MPITSAAAWGKLTAPAYRAARVAATPALEDWVTTVVTTPSSTSCNRPNQVSEGNRSGVMMPVKPPMASCMAEMPTKISPNPARAKPAWAHLPWVNSRRLAPTKISGSITVLNFSLKPRIATNHPVIVVPTLAPKIMPRAAEKLISPALTKPMVATVVALEDCKIAVVAAPVNAPDRGLWVNRINAVRMAFPARALSPSVMTIMPNKNNPDSVELLRATHSVVVGAQVELNEVLVADRRLAGFVDDGDDFPWRFWWSTRSCRLVPLRS